MRTCHYDTHTCVAWFFAHIFVNFKRVLGRNNLSIKKKLINPYFRSRNTIIHALNFKFLKVPFTIKYCKLNCIFLRKMKKIDFCIVFYLSVVVSYPFFFFLVDYMQICIINFYVLIFKIIFKNIQKLEFVVKGITTIKSVLGWLPKIPKLVRFSLRTLVQGLYWIIKTVFTSLRTIDVDSFSKIGAETKKCFKLFCHVPTYINSRYNFCFLRFQVH